MARNTHARPLISTGIEDLESDGRGSQPGSPIRIAVIGELHYRTTARARDLHSELDPEGAKLWINPKPKRVAHTPPGTVGGPIDLGDLTQVIAALGALGLEVKPSKPSRKQRMKSSGNGRPGRDPRRDHFAQPTMVHESGEQQVGYIRRVKIP